YDGKNVSRTVCLKISNRLLPYEKTKCRMISSKLSNRVVSNKSCGLNLKASSHKYLITFSGNLRILLRASRISYSRVFCSGVRSPSRSALNRALYSLRRLLSVELAFSSYFKSFSCTKYTPRRLSSADAILALLPTTILLIVVQNIFQVTSVSRITASAREERTFSKVFSISRIFHLRWNAVSNVKTFWSDV